MFRILRIIAAHPVFVYLIIIMLECIPYVKHTKIFNEIPEAGVNFRPADSPTVYYYSGKGKYAYVSADCYFSFGNPPFETSPEAGGIKTLNKEIADAIPLLGEMCGGQKIENAAMKTVSPYKKFLSTNYLLDEYSNISHVISYMLLSLSLLFYFRPRKNLFVVVFAICFTGGAILEFVQKYFIEGRTASFEDQFLNCVGATLGILIFIGIRKLKVM